MDDNRRLLRLYELALRALDDSMDDEEFVELNEMLNENPQSLETYYELMTTCSCIYRDLGESLRSQHHADSTSADTMNSLWSALAEEERTAETIELPEPEEQSQTHYVQVRPVALPKRTISKFSLFSTIVSTAAILLAVAYVHLVPVPRPSVAQLTETYQARWAGNTSFIEGDDLTQDYMELLSGYAHITFNNGGSAIIEGPARFELESEGLLYLQSGKVSCSVPASAVGFTVGTPTATVVDFGTEFGVVVQDSGRTEAHVFKGQVDLRTGSDPLVFEASRRLNAGQSSVVDENQILQPRRLQARPNQFIRTELVPYEIAIRNSKPFAYWRFDTYNQDVFQDILENGHQTCEFHGNVKIVAGPSLGNGKTSGAIQLDGRDSYVYVPKTGDRGDVNKSDRDFSYSFWIRPDVIRAQDLITVTNKGAAQYRHIGLDDSGRFTFFNYILKTQKKISTFSGNTIFEPNQWYHVVVTGQRTQETSSKLSLYVNGRQDASKDVYNIYSPRFFGNFYVGSVPEEGKSEGVQSFEGTITEIVEYDRALTPEDVQEIYSSVQE